MKSPQTPFCRMIQPFFIILLIGGFNLVHNYNIYMKIASRIYSTALMIVIYYASLTCCPSTEWSFIWSLIEYAVFSVIMMFYESRLPSFFLKLKDLDIYLRVNKRHYLRACTRILSTVLGMFVIRLIYLLFYCIRYTCFSSIFKFLIYQFSMFALDITRLWRFHVFYEIGFRLSLLRKRMEEHPDQIYYLYVNKNKAMKEDKIKLGLKLYKKIADLLDLLSPEINASLFMGVTSSLPKLVINVYRILLIFSHKVALDYLGIMVFNIFQTTIFIISPCIVIERYQVEVERIRLYLIDRLTRETNSEVKEDIQLFIQYTKIRNFRYKVCRVFAMDLQLPLQLLNHCTTYVIVIVNFTKVFD